MAARLDLSPITVDEGLLSKTRSREPFDHLAVEMLARAGKMVEQVVSGVQRETVASGLSLDEAVIGGLLVRLGKLTRGVFDSAQTDESEAHLVLSRSAAETAIVLVWLVRRGTSEHRRRFRADSFAYWRGQLERMRPGAPGEDEVMRSTRERVERHVAHEMASAGVGWEDVPKRSNSWGPDMRQRCAQLGIEWIYDSFFASHSSYVHPSWHELRAFHLSSAEDVIRLEPTFGGMLPIGGYVLARLIAEACDAAAEALPCDIDSENLADFVNRTTTASRILSMHFSAFVGRGGVDEYLQGHRMSPLAGMPSSPLTSAKATRVLRPTWQSWTAPRLRRYNLTR